MWNPVSLEYVDEDSLRNFSNTSCHRFSEEQVDVIQTTKLVVASVGALASIIVILLIVISRNYKRFVFRIVVYFMSVNLFQALTNILKVIPVHYDGTKQLVAIRDGWESACAVFGFLDQVALCAVDVVIIWIILYLLKLTWYIYRAQTGNGQTDWYTNGLQSNIISRSELCGLFLTVLLPLVYSWIPFVKNMYGLSGLWCWIKPTQHYCDGDYSLGLTLMFAVQFGPFLLVYYYSPTSVCFSLCFFCALQSSQPEDLLRGSTNVEQEKWLLF